ncbi:hypothetical protein ACFQ1M_04710 [Sungkyunkwania multivorans]|uniref:Uncharacterized protein n=1 Tax=Sungkyunkwania multivorans TaxID=1173618 RepID=A0ABW3CXC2_9FLAO
MKNLEKSLSITELEERHEMAAVAPEGVDALEIERCRDRCGAAEEQAFIESYQQ